MTRNGFDAFTIANLPANAGDHPNLIFAYANGYLTSKNYAQAVARFPGAQILDITVNGDLNIRAAICDVETGDYTIQGGIEWAHIELAASIKPTLYGSRDTYAQLFRVLGTFASYWVATLDGTHFTGPGVVACQVSDNGGLYDSSVVYDDTWHPLAPTFPPWPGRYMRLSNPYMVGADVQQYQNRMRQRGWTISTDSVFGPQTDSVTRAFQAEKGLGVDGVVGPATWNAAWTLPIT